MDVLMYVWLVIIKVLITNLHKEGLNFSFCVLGPFEFMSAFMSAIQNDKLLTFFSASWWWRIFDSKSASNIELKVSLLYVGIDFWPLNCLYWTQGQLFGLKSISFERRDELLIIKVSLLDAGVDFWPLKCLYWTQGWIFKNKSVSIERKGEFLFIKVSLLNAGIDCWP